MTYPGTPSLAAEIQQRILSTFQQTLELASQGKTHEALLGCDFILRLDAGFEPARTLMGRLGESGGTAVEVADLKRMAGLAVPASGAAPAGARAAASAPRAPAPGEARPPQPGSATGAAAVASALAAGLKDLLAGREFKRLVQIADENRQEVAANAELRKLVETAYARLEAEPYVKGFLDSARVSLQTGDAEEAERLLAKARSLDPTHPGIAEIEQAKGFYEDPARRLGGRRQQLSIEEETPAVAAGARAEAAGEDGEILHGFDLFPEEPGPDFSAAAALAPPPPAAAASPPARERGDGRIADLLDQGQAAFDRGDHQGSIDAWSRIFLIDIDHQEAARRIEQARRLKAEGERQAEEAYHDALAALEDGDTETARAGFEQVLELMPGHLAARESLDQLDSGVPAAAGSAGLPALSPLPVAGPTG
jgi:tetratricopeptide (TPR) repeat protein